MIIITLRNGAGWVGFRGFNPNRLTGSGCSELQSNGFGSGLKSGRFKPLNPLPLQNRLNGAYRPGNNLY